LILRQLSKRFLSIQVILGDRRARRPVPNVISFRQEYHRIELPVCACERLALSCASGDLSLVFLGEGATLVL
jgi:hypothetical protein